jgi:hypothetical protein
MNYCTHLTQISGFKDHAMTQEVCCRPLFADIRVCSWVSQCGLYERQNGFIFILILYVSEEQADKACKQLSLG